VNPELEFPSVDLTQRLVPELNQAVREAYIACRELKFGSTEGRDPFQN
jgi:hypothetical protein